MSIHAGLVPNEALKLVRAWDGSIELLMRHPYSGQVVTIAKVMPIQPASDQLKIANMLSAAFLLAHALNDHIEYCQPEIWGDGEDPEMDMLWRKTFRAWCTAVGEPIAENLLEPEVRTEPA